MRGVRKCLLPRTPRAARHRLECRGARLPGGEGLRRVRPRASSCAAVLLHGEGHVVLVRDTHRWLLEWGAGGDRRELAVGVEMHISRGEARVSPCEIDVLVAHRRVLRLRLELGSLPRLTQGAARVAACVQRLRLGAQRLGPPQRALQQRHRGAVTTAAAAAAASSSSSSSPQSRLRDDEAAWAKDPARGELLRDADEARASGRRSAP